MAQANQESRIMRRDGKRYLQMRDAIAGACSALILRPGIKEDSLQRFAVSKALKGLLWHYTEQTSLPGNALYCCPFWSRGALARRQELREHFGENTKAAAKELSRALQVEHVVRREDVEKALLDATDAIEVRRYLDCMRTCVVLKTPEHAALPSKNLFNKPITEPEAWWWRYENKIIVCKGPNYHLADSMAGSVFDRIWEFICELPWQKIAQ